MLKLFVVDDSKSLRERLAAASSEIPGVELIGQAGNVRVALEGIRRLRPDVVVLDIHMPDGSGMGLLETLKRETPATRVIMFTNHDLPQYREYCRRAGADYFFAKNTDFVKLVEVLTSLAQPPELESFAFTPSADPT